MEINKATRRFLFRCLNMYKILIGIILMNCCYSFSQNFPDSCDYFIPNTLTIDCCSYSCEILEIISNCEFTDFQLSIYNKSAEIIFQSNNPKTEFDIRNYGENCYYWKLSATFCNSQKIEDNGYISILK